MIDYAHNSFHRRIIPVLRHNNEVTMLSILSPAAQANIERSRSASQAVCGILAAVTVA